MRARQLQTVTTPLGSDAFLLGDTGFSAFGPLVTSTFPVPGLGFDFAHLAAISRNFKVSDISVLTTAQRLALAQRLASLNSFSVPFLAASPVVLVQQPPVVVVQQPAAAEEIAEAAERTPRVGPRDAEVAARVPEPAHDAGEFVLVRLDGRLVFAVAFSTQGDLLTYVTREGLRRSLRLTELDIDATRRMNEGRGTTIHLPV
ncbi:MAG TPA: hypothetical protein VHM88_13295 [Candidatus Acidoferrales bacterium]|nr:hypothetical protein [Candidatus Acidoferrales bacterium]